jgi:hypothetical protein
VAVLASGTTRLCWRDREWALTPVSGEPAKPGEKLVALETVGASGDVSFAKGHFYPNKPPGLSLIAAPAYALVLGFEKAMRWNPDEWRLLTFNAWATTVLSVGVISALAAVVLFRVAGRFTSIPIALGIAVAYALGTMAFPYGTMLFDQNITAAALLLAFALLMRARDGEKYAWWFAVLAGLSGGIAVLCNYVAGPILLFLFLYAKGRLRSWFLNGTVLPLALFVAYHALCFGSHLCTAGQNPLFNSTAHSGPVLFGMFSFPNPWIAAALLFSPFRGLFYLSPILALATWGLWYWYKTQRREVLFCLATFGFFFGVNSCFEGWHGGFGVAPRYLGPAIPFLALGLVALWPRRPRLCSAVTVLSICFQFALTATDPVSPVGTGDLARIQKRSDWSYDPLFDYAVPFLINGQATPLLRELSDEYVEKEQARLAAKGFDLAKHASEVSWLRTELKKAIQQHEPTPFPLAAFRGPVSVNPVGICEGGFFRLFDAHTDQARWNAFNIGEFFYPECLWSLAPILAGGAALLVGAAMNCRKCTQSEQNLAPVARPAVDPEQQELVAQ